MSKSNTWEVESGRGFETAVALQKLHVPESEDDFIHSWCVDGKHYFQGRGTLKEDPHLKLKEKFGYYPHSQLVLYQWNPYTVDDQQIVDEELTTIISKHKVK